MCVRIPPGAWMSVYCEWCVVPGRGLCDELITCPVEFYLVKCVWVWSWILDNEGALAHWGAVAWMSVYCEWCVVPGRGLCDELITCPVESYLVKCVWVWLWILDNEGPWPTGGLLHIGKKKAYDKRFLYGTTFLFQKVPSNNFVWQLWWWATTHLETINLYRQYGEYKIFSNLLPLAQMKFQLCCFTAISITLSN
jgi:hypothetical protein